MEPGLTDFQESCVSLSHDFSAAPKQLASLIEVQSHANFNLLEMQVKPELRYAMDDSGEDVDAEYMLEMPLDCAGGADAMTTDEHERRRIRRERNKVAASKCRKKRKEHVKTLVETSEELEHQNIDLQGQISKLQAEIKQLEFMLDSHSCSKYSHCHLDDQELGLTAN